MNIQDLVPDREICQEAKEKGVVIESINGYYSFSSTQGVTAEIGIYENTPYEGDYDTYNFIANAPLTDEILKVLPQQFGGQDLEIIKLPHDIYSCGYPRDIMGRGINYYKDKKLSNALLLLAIKLTDEKIIN
jgi:hypothetical protein